MSGAVRETTTYFDFEIPSFDFPGWHTYYDRNIKTMDSILYLMTGTDSLKGTWKNSTAYNVGDRVVDIQVSFAYECFVAHTSAAAPTLFSADRIAHPDYWHAIDFIQALSGSSSSSMTIGLGTKVFATQTGRIFIAGAKVIITSAANPTVDFMWGSVISYTGSTLTVAVDSIGGSGTHSDWLISVSGVKGEQGIQGPIGLQGPQGIQGPEGPEGDVGPQGIMAEAPTTGSIYGRKGSTATWEVVSSSSAAVLPITPSGSISSTTVQDAIYELDSEKVAKAGGTMTGALILNADPTNPLGAATKQYADLGGGDKVFRAGDTMTGILQIRPPADNPRIRLIKLPGTQANYITGWVQGTPDLTRWGVQFGNPTPETGGNAGSDFVIERYNDAGTISGTPLQINRANGVVSLQNSLNVTENINCAGMVISASDIRTYRASPTTAGTVYFGQSSFGAYLHYNGTDFSLNGGSLYTGAITTQGSSLTTGAATAASLTSPAITCNWSDGFRHTVPPGHYARMIMTVTGTRAWSAGLHADGHYRIMDESAGTTRCIMYYHLNRADFLGDVYATNFYGTLQGSITGNANYANTAGSAGTAGYATSAGTAGTASGLNTDNAWIRWIEGPNGIDMVASGHEGHDYCTRIYANTDHTLDISTTIHVNGTCHTTGDFYAPNHILTVNGPNGSWTSGWMYEFMSSGRYKQDIKPLTKKDADNVLLLQPMTFRSKCPADDPDQIHIGLIAEDVAKICPHVVFRDYLAEDYTSDKDEKSGGIRQVLREGAKKSIKSINYNDIVTMLLHKVQEQEKRIEALEDKLATRN